MTQSYDLAKFFAQLYQNLRFSLGPGVKTCQGPKMQGGPAFV